MVSILDTWSHWVIKAKRRWLFIPAGSPDLKRKSEWGVELHDKSIWGGHERHGKTKHMFNLSLFSLYWTELRRKHFTDSLKVHADMIKIQNFDVIIQNETESMFTYNHSQQTQCRGFSLPAPESLSSGYFWLPLLWLAGPPAHMMVYSNIIMHRESSDVWVWQYISLFVTRN